LGAYGLAVEAVDMTFVQRVVRLSRGGVHFVAFAGAEESVFYFIRTFIKPALCHGIVLAPAGAILFLRIHYVVVKTHAGRRASGFHLCGRAFTRAISVNNNVGVVIEVLLAEL